MLDFDIGIECTDPDALHGSYNGEGMLRMFVEWMFVFVLPCHCRTFGGFLCALSHGVCGRVAEALRVEALANVSRMLSEHRMLDLCVAPVRLSSVASLKLFFLRQLTLFT